LHRFVVSHYDPQKLDGAEGIKETPRGQMGRDGNTAIQKRFPIVMRF
jgi:hypothetical protein